MFEIVIATKNRRDDLIVTLRRVQPLLSPKITCRVFDDGSTDNTFEAVRKQFPTIEILRNETSKGYLFCRNYLLNTTTADFAISLDDDANFLSDDPIENLSEHFEAHPNCGVAAFRIFWGKQEPSTIDDTSDAFQVRSFVGCGHAWRMSAWKKIANYPEWFEFYGEENTASMELFRKNFSVDYVPSVLVHHRVDMGARRSQLDYEVRLRRSLRAGWYYYLMYLPWTIAAKKIGYSIWSQFKNRIFKGKFGALKILMFASFDVLKNSLKIAKQSNRLTKSEYAAFSKLPEARLYWSPANDSKL